MTTSVDIAGRCINAKCALRLRESGYIKGFEQGQTVTLSRSRSAPVRKKVLFAAIVGTFTGHSPIDIHAIKLKNLTKASR